MNSGVTSSEDWHALDPALVRSTLATQETGLSDEEAQARLRQFGPNELEDEPPASAIVVLLRQFRSPLIYILLAATVVTLLLEEYLDSAVIAVVLALNAAIGFTQERKAEGAVRALQQLVVPRAHVVRDGRETEVDSRDLVPGDLVVLEPGAFVPADLRITSDNSLQIDESLLTGESLPVTKQSAAVDAAVSLADRRSMAHTGSVVTSGRGRGLVVATGTETELGAIAGLIRAEKTVATPLQQRMEQFGRLIGVAIGVAAVTAFVSGVALGGSADGMFLTAVALAVAAIPEGLPVVLTVTLALGVRRMARRKAIVRRLPAVETLGSTTVIGSDKTGTLTENRMTVQEIWTPGRRFMVNSESEDRHISFNGEPVDVNDHANLQLALLAGVLTNEADVHRSDDGETQLLGDPTETALLVAATTAGIEPGEARTSHPLVKDIPFEADRRYSAAARDRDGTHTWYVKGAPERVTDMCTHMLTDHGSQPIDHQAVHDAAQDLAADGLRVLAMAYRPLPDPRQDGEDPGDPEDLILLGLQGMMDPPRHGVREAVTTCHEAGIRVIMITGDHAVTASAIARDLGIAEADAPTLTGRELTDLSDEELRERVDDVAVYARVSPKDKLRIVHALQALGNVVAVTGDGVNDGPALKAAAIGVAMGRSGTDVAREASDMVLTDDNFVSISAAVEEGRVTFDNVRKVTVFLVSTGVATIAAILFGVWAQWPLLMLPAQLLWLNLVTNGLQDVALAFEPGEKDAIRRPPRPTEEGVLSRLSWQRVALAGLVMATGTLAMFRWELDRTDSVAQAQTIALTTMVVAMAFHAGNSRSESVSVLRMNPLSNPFLLIATTAAVATHIAALYLPPTQYILRVEPIDLAAWIRLVPVAATVLVAVEADKLIRRRLQARRQVR